jgi:hypothetical protein
MSPQSTRSVRVLLTELGCGRDAFVSCGDDREAQFKVVKRGYIAACLRTHPD